LTIIAASCFGFFKAGVVAIASSSLYLDISHSL
jgi:hypothetical protein